MVPLNLTYLHCLQHSSSEQLFNLYKTFKSAGPPEIHIFAYDVKITSMDTLGVFKAFGSRQMQITNHIETNKLNIPYTCVICLSRCRRALYKY